MSIAEHSALALYGACYMPRYVTAVHEGAGHSAAGFLLGCPPSHASIHSDGSGITVYERARSHRKALMTCLAGHIAEQLLLPAADVSVERSAGDFGAASKHALAVAMTFDHVRKANEARARGPASPAEPSILHTLTEEALDAAIAAGVERLYARRVARAGQIIAAAEASVRDLLSANPCVMRTLAVALERYGELDEAQLLEVYELGQRRQAEDDERYGNGGRRT